MPETPLGMWEMNSTCSIVEGELSKLNVSILYYKITNNILDWNVTPTEPLKFQPEATTRSRPTTQAATN